MTGDSTERLAEGEKTSPTTILSTEEIDRLVLDNQGWAESIARSVARAWNMDWRGDGLDGAALEALLFCARRFDPSRGIPFRGYARRRIHEASTEEARKSKSWANSSKGGGENTEEESRKLSIKLLDAFPELRDGYLPGGEDDDMRGSIRTMLVGASISSLKEGIETSTPEDFMDIKKVIEIIASLEPVHQLLLWKTYWEGHSLRTVAEGWETDELNVIREHKVIIDYLTKCFASSKKGTRPKVRPGLRTVAFKVKKESETGPFTQILEDGRGAKHLQRR
jgi:DNA-directed RNA polymerase specialized sigma subunit